MLAIHWKRQCCCILVCMAILNASKLQFMLFFPFSFVKQDFTFPVSFSLLILRSPLLNLNKLFYVYLFLAPCSEIQRIHNAEIKIVNVFYYFYELIISDGRENQNKVFDCYCYNYKLMMIKSTCRMNVFAIFSSVSVNSCHLQSHSNDMHSQVCSMQCLFHSP